ncbi:MAG: class I poly(R)-hydroxyalkanoic acid synthase [Proteobacteria bacterium]|nr:class I poly(R)-hydroxyalkanoic acid synthase [Pseudomonadota bacterium]
MKAMECYREVASEMVMHEKPEDIYTSIPSSVSEAFGFLWNRLMENPTEFVRMQMEYFYEMSRIAANASLRFMGNPAAPLYNPSDKDRRFKDEAWQNHVLFDFLKQSYVLTSSTLERTIASAHDIDPKTQQKLNFFSRQFIDAISPSNFLLTNPEVLKKTVESNGENLVKGMENLLKDMKTSDGILRISMTDRNAFALGRNIAMTPGKVVFQNDLVQIIQYTPTTKEVYETPLLIVSPWINKYYILDMQPENSFVKWLVDKGHTVFITSWVNPDARHANKSFEDYMKEGALDGIEAVKKATGEKQINVIGYCIGGTLMASALAYLTAKQQADSVKSITYLTTLVDFSEPGEIGAFIDEGQISEMEEHMNKKGYLESDKMATTFNMLRANELIWSFVVNNYLMGKNPFPFDLLYWNMDSTRLPAAMHSFYLRNMYLTNKLVQPKALSMCGVPIDLRNIKTPAYMLSTQGDHIAPWKSTYAATSIYKGPIRFVLSGSGHIAGVVNPPVKKKYGYWTNERLPATPDEWFDKSTPHEGSWWEDWQRWIESTGFVGKKVPARVPKNPIEDAPGSYVKG